MIRLQSQYGIRTFMLDHPWMSCTDAVLGDPSTTRSNKFSWLNGRCSQVVLMWTSAISYPSTIIYTSFHHHFTNMSPLLFHHLPMIYLPIMSHSFTAIIPAIISLSFTLVSTISQLVDNSQPWLIEHYSLWLSTHHFTHSGVFHWMFSHHFTILYVSFHPRLPTIHPSFHPSFPILQSFNILQPSSFTIVYPSLTPSVSP